MTERKILVVDDEEIIRDMMEMALSRLDYTVLSAENAWEILRFDDYFSNFSISSGSL